MAACDPSKPTRFQIPANTNFTGYTHCHLAFTATGSVAGTLFLRGGGTWKQIKLRPGLHSLHTFGAEHPNDLAGGRLGRFRFASKLQRQGGSGMGDGQESGMFVFFLRLSQYKSTTS